MPSDADKSAAEDIKRAFEASGKASISVLPSRCVESNWLQSYLEYVVDTESPDVYHMWCAISTIAAALKRNCSMDMGILKPLYPNLYVVLTGPSAEVKKSAALDIAQDFIEEVKTVNVIRDKMTPEGLVEKLSTQLDIAAAANNIVKWDHTCFCVQDELASMMSNVSYTQGLDTLIVQLYNNRNKYDVTLKHHPIHLECIQMNLLAASTPEWLATGMPDVHKSGGLIGRFIFVVAYRPKKKISFPKMTDRMREVRQLLVTDLITISKMRGEFTRSPEAEELYDEWYQEYKPGEDPRLKEYQGRKPATTMKLAMILSASISNQMVIEAKHIRAAWTILDKMEHNMPDAFMFLGSTEEHKLARVVLSILASFTTREGNPPMARKGLLRAISHRVRRIGDFNEVMEMLIQEDRIKKVLRGTKLYYTLTTEEEMKEAEEIKRRNASILDGIFNKDGDFI